MKNHLTILVLLAFSCVAFAQKGSNMAETSSVYDETYAQMHIWHYELTSALDTSTIKDIIARERFLNEGDQLRVVAIKTSHTATHITFKQLYNGIEVFGGGAKVAVSDKNILFRCIETLFPTATIQNFPQSSFNPLPYLSAFNAVNVKRSVPVFLWNGDILLPGWYAEFLYDEIGYADAAWLKNGQQFFLRDRNSYFTGPDSTVTVQVFYPDPITPIGQTYGGQYVDMNDGNTAILDPLRVSSTMKVNFENGVFSLKSDYVEITEHSAPALPIVTAATPDFSFSRSDDGFEQANAYYHIMNFQAYLQQMGYTLVDFAIHVDAQGFGGSDNSAYTGGAVPPRLTFGEGGVDDAEDADVIVHEYGHAISDDASPSTNTGLERRTLDEAFGDYLAVSYTREQYSFGSNLVFNWDGHNSFWPGRTVDNPSNFNYKSISGFNEIYRYATLWNAAMFDIWDQLGKTYTDSLQLEAVYGYFQNMSFSQAALLVIQADTTFSGGANGQIIWKAFDDRGILDWSAITEENSSFSKPYILNANVLQNLGSLKMRWLDDIPGELNIYDFSGKLCAQAQLTRGENTLPLAQLTSGVYMVTVAHQGMYYTEKVIIVK